MSLSMSLPSFLCPLLRVTARSHPLCLLRGMIVPRFPSHLPPFHLLSTFSQWMLNGSSTQRHYNLIAKISQYLASSIRLLEIECKYTTIFSYFQIFPLHFVNKMPFLRCFPAILCRFHAKMPIFFRFLSIFLHISFFFSTFAAKSCKDTI